MQLQDLVSPGELLLVLFPDLLSTAPPETSILLTEGQQESRAQPHCWSNAMQRIGALGRLHSTALAFFASYRGEFELTEFLGLETMN